MTGDQTVSTPGHRRRGYRLWTGSAARKSASLSALSFVVGFIVFATASVVVDRDLDGPFDFATGLLGGILTGLLSRAYSSGRLWLGHPTTVMALVMMLYWLLGGLVARATPEVLLSPRASDWLAMSMVVGSLFMVGFASLAGVPRQEHAEPIAPPRIDGLSFWVIASAVSTLWALRLYEVASGSYFHGIGRLELYDASVGFLTQLEIALEFAVPYLIALLWCRGQRRAALVLGGIEFLFLFASGKRLPVIWFALVLAICMAWMNRPVRISTLLVVALMSVFVIHPVMLAMRSVAETDPEQHEGIGPARALSYEVPQALGNLDGNLDREEVGLAGVARRSTASGYVAAVMDRLSQGRGSLLDGESYLKSAPMLVPHFLWAEKNPGGIYDPMDRTSANFRFWGVDYIYTPITEAFCNFGTLGVLGLSLILGLFARFLWSQVQAHRTDPALACTLALLLRPWIQFETHSTMGNLATFRVSIPLFAALLLIRKSSTYKSIQVTERWGRRSLRPSPEGQ
jgi:hypothetical protein